MHAHTLAAAPLRTSPFSPRRRVRALWAPAPAAGPYRLPATILDRLSRDLAGFRNRDAALSLAVLLARVWSVPGRITLAFPVDRRALAGRRTDLGLTEAQVRGALRTLEAIGFLARPPVIGRTHRATPNGDLHRRPILWRFAVEFVALFRAAHGKRRAAQDGVSRQGLSRHPVARTCLPMSPATALARSPKGKARAESELIMGQQLSSGTLQRGSRWEMPGSAIPCPALDAALARLIAARRRSA